MENLPSIEVVLMGDPGVGKTCFVKQCMSGELEPRYVSTIGCDMDQIQHDGFVINFRNIGGGERFGMLWKGYCEGANIGVFVGEPDKWEETFRECAPNAILLFVDRIQDLNLKMIVEAYRCM